MRRVRLVIGVASVFCGIFACFVLCGTKRTASVAPDPEAARKVAHGYVSRETPGGNLEMEVQQLREQLRVKDQVIRDLVARATSTPTAGVSRSPEPKSLLSDKIARTCEVLDERMFATQADSREVIRMKSEIQLLMDADTLGETRIASLECGTSICKMMLIGENNAVVSATTRRMAKRIPKAFASTMFYTTKNGEQTIYFATRATDLSVDLQEEATE